jgi:hypothetical protein
MCGADDGRRYAAILIMFLGNISQASLGSGPN